MIPNKAKMGAMINGRRFVLVLVLVPAPVLVLVLVLVPVLVLVLAYSLLVVELVVIELPGCVKLDGGNW